LNTPSLLLTPSELASGELPKEKRDQLEKGQGKVNTSGRPLEKPYPDPYTNPPSKKPEPGKAEPAKEPAPAPAPKPAVKPAPKAVPKPVSVPDAKAPEATTYYDSKPKVQPAPINPPSGTRGENPPPTGKNEPIKRIIPFPIDNKKEEPQDNTKPQAVAPITQKAKPQSNVNSPADEKPEDDWVPSRRASDRPAPPPPQPAEAPKAEPKTVKPDWFVRTPGSPTKSGEAGYLTTKDREGEVYPGTDIPRSAVMSGSGAAERAAQLRGHSVDKYEVGMTGPRYQHKGKWYSADPTDAEMEQKKKSQTTKEETQMSINKRYGVSDQLYSSVMEVLAKHKGTPPRHEKEKKLAAMHGDPNTITHGDVLKARGVKMKEETKQVDEMSSKMKMKLGLYGKKKKTNEEAESIQEKNTDTPGNSYEHQCAIHVKSESFGEGRTITTQHADPDENGNIAWYDVMFEHGIEKHVPTSSLEILVSESHMHSKRKKKAM
jgi:hypothetical protein